MPEHDGYQQAAPVALPSDAVHPTAFATGQDNHVHHSYIWLGSLVGVLAVVAVAVASNIGGIITLAMNFDVGGNVLLWVLLALAGFAVLYGIVVAVSVLAYKNLRYVFDEKEFSLYSGIFVKRRVHVPYARVQSVNHRQSLVQRIAGVCTVEIDTAGGATNKAVKVPYVQLGTGEAIRRELFVRKAASLSQASQPEVALAGHASALQPGAAPAGQPEVTPSGQPEVAPAGQPEFAPSGQPVGTWTGRSGAVPGGQSAFGHTAPVPPALAVEYAAEHGQDWGNALDGVVGGIADDFRGIYGDQIVGLEPVSFERRLTNKELLLASVSNSGIIAMLVSAAFLVVAGFVPMAMFAPEYRWMGAFMVPLALGVAVVLAAISIAGTALSFGNFSVRRRGSRIEVERGVLQRDFSGIDIDRIQSLVVKQSFIRRLMGYCEVSLGRINASGGDDQNTQAKLNAGGLVVHPFVKLDQVNDLVSRLLPEYDDRPVAADFVGLPAVALRRSIIRRCVLCNGLFWIAVCYAVFQVAFNMLFANALAQSGLHTTPVVDYVNVVGIVIYACLVIQIPATIVGCVWWKRGSGFALNRRYLALCNDGLSTETVYLPRQKVQNTLVSTNPFQRMAHVTTIGATSAAGVGGSHPMLWDVTEEDGQTWLDWLAPRGANANPPARGNA